MTPVRIARRADLDMDSVWDHIARSSPNAANRWIDFLRKKFHFLSRYPEAGEVCPELALGIRRFVAGNYAIYYQIFDDQIEIVRVIHAARAIGAAFED